MKTLKFKNTEVKLSFDSYRNNGTLAVLMNTVPDEELYAVITVNLGRYPSTGPGVVGFEPSARIKDYSESRKESLVE